MVILVKCYNRHAALWLWRPSLRQMQHKWSYYIGLFVAHKVVGGCFLIQRLSMLFKYSIWTLLEQTELQEWQKKQQLDKYTEAVSCLAHGQIAWKQNLWKIQNIEYFCENVPPEFPPLWSTVAEMSCLYMSSVSVKTIRGTSIIRNCKIRAPMIVFNTITELWSGF